MSSKKPIVTVKQKGYSVPSLLTLVHLNSPLQAFQALRLIVFNVFTFELQLDESDFLLD